MSVLPDSVQSERRKLAYADWEGLPDDANRYEILDGELAVTPPPTTRHQGVSRNLFVRLYAYVSQRKLGSLYYAPVGVILDDTTIVEPDLVFVSAARKSLIKLRAIEGPPDLVVEILSPSTSRRDRATKAALYARYGVQHYWIVDPDARTVEVFELGGGSYRLVAAYGERDRLRCGLFPELVIDLNEIWE